jgi:hypothetical protein
MIPVSYIGKAADKSFLIVKNAEFVCGSDDIYQMMGNHLPVNQVIIKVLARPDIQSTVYLTGIGGDDLSPQVLGQESCQSGLAGGSRPQNNN